MANRRSNLNKIPKIFLGVYSVVLLNDVYSLKRTDELHFADDAILLNADHIENRSLAFAIACLCHEMIHYYDRLFGEYCIFTKCRFILGKDVDMHNTTTFENMTKTANKAGINVI